MLLCTAQGERVMVPTYGCDLWQFVFPTVTTSLLTELRDFVRDAIEDGEQRIDLLGVQAIANPDQAGRVDINVAYRVRSTNVAREIWSFLSIWQTQSRPEATDMAARDTPRPLLISRWARRASPRRFGPAMSESTKKLRRRVPAESVHFSRFLRYFDSRDLPDGTWKSLLSADRSISFALLATLTSGAARRRSRRSPNGCGARRMSTARKSRSVG